MLDFDDAALEWRRLFSELFGTFLLVLVGAGGGVVDARQPRRDQPRRGRRRARPDGDGDHPLHGRRLRRPPQPGGDVRFSLRGDFPWRRVPGYLVVQLAGATLACLFLWAVYGKVGISARPSPGPQSATGRRC